MIDFKVPAAEAADEFIEKKSRFIGHIFKVQSAEEAAGIIKQMQKKYWDASHNVYAYIVEEGRVMRYSDDGEPQGTGGMPVLEVLKREELYDVLCVVTRYFGGVLLGAGGLTRAYAKGAKIAVDAAGIAVMRPYRFATLRCPYAMLETVRAQFARQEVEETATDYAEEVTLTLCMAQDRFESYQASLTELSGGTLKAEPGEVQLFAKRLS